jgi:tetratricopeptide (TPR) repeat protein
MNRMMKPCLTFSATLAFACSLLPAAEFQGAEAILRQIAAASARPATGSQDAAAELAEKLARFRSARHALAPADAAAQWLALFDAYRKMPPVELRTSAAGGGTAPISMETLISSLPPSAGWAGIRAGLETRAAHEPQPLGSTLQLFATVVGNDNEQRLKAIDALQVLVDGKSANDRNSFDYLAASRIERMREALEFAESDPKKAVEAFERRLAAAEAPSRKSRYDSESTLVIPDLVKLAGPEQARRLLARAVVLNRSFDVKGQATRALLVEAATLNADRLKKPQWELVTGHDGLRLYEAMAEKFSTDDSSYRRIQANQVYLLGLVDEGRTAEAKEFFKKQFQNEGVAYSAEAHALSTMDRNGLIGKWYAFLKDLQILDPELFLWNDLQVLAGWNGQSADFMKTLEGAMAKPRDPAQLAELKQIYLDHLLAIGRVDEGVALLREKISTPSGDLGDQGFQLLQIGRLLQRPEWVEEGLAAVRTYFQTPKDRNDYGSDFSGKLVDLLVPLGRGAEAEKLLVERLMMLHQSNGDAQNYGIRQILSALVHLYDETGRTADALLLLDQSPDWLVSDVKELSGSVPLVAAHSLAAAGRYAEAAAIARQVIQGNGGSDPAYELLLKLGGDDLASFLDQTYAADRFEERPLIWKARLLLDQGKIEDAEKTIRQAIAVDPSDGEQGKGDRLRAYAVLADVSEKKGDATQAATLRTAVRAIRLSEDADDWHAAGLRSKAVAMYEESLDLFADAYCIQSRLARRLTEMGEFEKAAEHYRRAFELMPDSFGRVESHCFGCEGTFSDPKAQTTAEKVFATLAEQLPDRAQVFYLFGYLREEQGRAAEAAALFQKAVKLDPDYLNAWAHLASIATEAGLPASETDEIQLQILRLDPFGRHGNFNAQGFSDLRKCWDGLLAADRSLPPYENRPLYPLAASKLALEEKRKATADTGGRPSRSWEWIIDEEHDSDPRARLMRRFGYHPLVGAATDLLQAAIHGE